MPKEKLAGYPAVVKDASFKVKVHYDAGSKLEFWCAGPGAEEVEIVHVDGGDKVTAAIKVPIESLSKAVALLKHEAGFDAKRGGG